MLHDAARKGDVEIPVFCYEPKLGEPVGACRMCLVEIEGIPKLQTSCSTPVRDGMVVHTRTEQVKHAQSAVVEFLLVNHPLDCPVCDKGGECPLQDISHGLGPGQEPGDRRKAPLREADRALAAGRDRPRALHPLLPLRALQPGGRRGRAAAAARARRPHLRRHLRRPPLRRALPRQHHRPLPGRGADQLHLPLPRPALGHRAGRLGLHALPEPVQRQLHRPRREGETGDRPRQRRGRRRLALRPRPLRLRDVRRRGAGRAGRACKAAPRRAGRTAIEAAAAGLLRAPAARKVAAIVGDASNEEGYLVQRHRCARRSARRTSTRAPRAGPAREVAGPARPARASRAKVRDIDDADAILVLGTDPLHSSPILDLRIRKAIRRNGARLARRDRAPDRARRRRRGDRPLRARRGAPTSSPSWPRRSAAPRTSPRRWPRACASAEQGRRHLGRADRPRRQRRREALLELAAALEHRRDRRRRPARSPRLRQRPRPARGRLPARRRPGPRPRIAPSGRHSGDRGDPRRPDQSGELKTASSSSASTRCATSPTPQPGKRRYRRRLRRLLLDLRERDHRQGRRRLPARDPRRERRHRHPPRRPPAARPPQRRPPRRHPPELGRPRRALPGPRPRHRRRLPAHCLRRSDRRGPLLRRHRPTPTSAAAASAGRTAPAAANAPAAGTSDRRADSAEASARRTRRRRSRASVRRVGPADASPARPRSLGTYRDLWAGPITELNPPLRFLAPQQRVELSARRRRAPRPEERRRGQGRPERHERRAPRSTIKERVAEGVCFLIEGIADGNANALLNGGPVRVEIEKVGRA